MLSVGRLASRRCHESAQSQALEECQQLAVGAVVGRFDPKSVVRDRACSLPDRAVPGDSKHSGGVLTSAVGFPNLQGRHGEGVAARGPWLS